MNNLLLEISIILLLLLANGVFAMTEIAVVSSRRARLRAMAEKGSAGARVALQLSEEPNRFLSTVQVGITLVGVLAGAFGGATLARQIAQGVSEWPVIGAYGEEIGIGAVVLGITYFSLILGELVPKRLALVRPEPIAAFMARPMNRLSQLASPLVSLLGYSTDAVLRIFGVKQHSAPSMTDEEVAGMVREGAEAGVFHPAEGTMVEGVMALDTLRVRDIMTPRPRMVWMDVEETAEGVWRKVVASRHSHYPVYDGRPDHLVGVLSLKSLYANVGAGAGAKVRDLMTSPLVVPEMQTAMQLLETFRKERQHIAFVSDEFGDISGLVTLIDIMEAIAGDLPSADEEPRPALLRREDGSLLVDALLGLEDVEKALGRTLFAPGETSEFQTVAGFMVRRLGRIPSEGESLQEAGLRWEVVDMDRHRVDKVLVTPMPEPGEVSETVMDNSIVDKKGQLGGE